MSRKPCVAFVAIASFAVAASSGGCASLAECVDPSPVLKRVATCEGDVLVETSYHAGGNGGRCEATTTRTTCAGPALTCIADGQTHEDGMPAKCENACVTDQDCDGLFCSREGSGGRHACGPAR